MKATDAADKHAINASASGAKHVLQGSVNEDISAQIAAQNRALGYLSIKDATTGKTVVTKVFPGSSAFYRGVRTGDEILSTATRESKGSLQSKVVIKRAGSNFMVDLSTMGDYRRFLEEGNATTTAETPRNDTKAASKQPMASLPASEVKVASSIQQSESTATAESPSSAAKPRETPRIAPTPTPTALQGNAQSNEPLHATIERALKGRDLVVLIDRSGSMDTTDCPGATSRWQWCRDQIANLSNETAGLMPHGFSLILFNNHCKSFPGVDTNSILQAFVNNKPDGGTDMASAVSKVLKEHRERKSINSPQPRLVVAIITDGVPGDERALRNTLISETKNLSTADELSIVFLQVGEDNQASAYLEELDRYLVQEGALFDVTRSVLFGDVKTNGLLRSLVTSVN